MVTYPDTEKNDYYLYNSEIYKKIGEIAKYRRGSFPQPYDNPEWYGGVGAMPFVQVADISDNMILNEKTNKTISVKAQPKSVFVPKGTVVISLQGSIGRVAITQYDSYIDRTVAVFQDLANNVDKKYFLYQLYRVFSEEKKTARGSTIKTITKEEFTEFQLPLPEKAEQEEIAHTISQFDAYINDLAELIEKKKGIREGALEDLITKKTRLDGFEDDWQSVSFNQVITPKARIGWQGLKKHEYLRSGYSYLIGGTDFSNGTVSLDNISYVSKERYDMDTNIQVSENDVLVTKDGTIGKVAIVPELNKPATLNSGVFVFRTNSRLVPAFLFRVLQSSVFREFIDTLSAGSTIKHLYQKDLKKFEFEIPVDTKEQEAIAAVLTVMDEEIRDLETEREKIIQIREGAMDALLTGRVRLTK